MEKVKIIFPPFGLFLVLDKKVNAKTSKPKTCKGEKPDAFFISQVAAKRGKTIITNNIHLRFKGLVLNHFL